MGGEGSPTPRGSSQEEGQPSDTTRPKGTSWGPEGKRTLHTTGTPCPGPALEKRHGDTLGHQLRRAPDPFSHFSVLQAENGILALQSEAGRTG